MDLGAFQNIEVLDGLAKDNGLIFRGVEATD